MPTTVDLGQLVKQKYPGSYDDIPDADLGQRIKTKYPGSYDDFSDAPYKDVRGWDQRALDSAGNFASGVASTVAHPIQTLQNAGQLAVGTVANMSGMDERTASPLVQQSQQKANAVGQFYKQRYGGLKNIGNTLYNDPVGTLADASTAAGAVGGATRGLGALARIRGAAGAADALTTAGDAVSNAGRVMNPLEVANAAASLPAKVIPRGAADALAQRMYQSALKPSTAMEDADRTAMIQEGLQSKIPVSKGGFKKNQQAIQGINNQLGNYVQQGAQQGMTVDPQTVAAQTARSRKQFANQVNPTGDLAAIDASRDEFLNVHGQQPIPLDQAWDLKKGTYKTIGDKYGELSGAETEAQKDLARGLKEEVYRQLEQQFPDIRQLGPREKNLINLDDTLSRFVGREGNRQLTGIGTPIFGQGVQNVTGNREATLLAMAARYLIDRNPQIKSRIAIALANRGGTPGAVGKTMQGIRSGLTKGERVNDAENGPTPYAVGGVVNQPTDAIVGEAGPEMRVPLGGIVPEDPRTLSIQMDQLQSGQRRAVLFPKGTPVPDRPDGLKQISVRDGMLYYQPGLVKPSELISASKAGRLNDVLGAADGGMGPQSKADIAATGQSPLAIIGKAADGTTAQGTLASPDQVSPAIQQTAKVTPPGGQIAVENPKQEILRRIRAGRRRR